MAVIGYSGGTCRNKVLGSTLRSTTFDHRMHLLRQGSCLHEITRDLGRGLEGTICALAHHVIWNTSNFVYGGFVRDFVVGGISHSAMDLDVGVVDGDHAGALVALRAWATANEIATVRQNTLPPLSSVFLRSLDGSTEVEVQLVNPAYKTFQTPVDFNVNNLKVERNGRLVQLALKKPTQENAGTVDSVCSDIAAGTLRLLRPVNEISERVNKMQSRGWTMAGCSK